jgi:hypothetical protein
VPSVVLREVGKSRLAYFAGDMDASCWRLDNVDLGRQFLTACCGLWVTAIPVQAKSEGLMEVAAWETEPGLQFTCSTATDRTPFVATCENPLRSTPRRPHSTSARRQNQNRIASPCRDARPIQAIRRVVEPLFPQSRSIRLSPSRYKSYGQYQMFFRLPRWKDYTL